MEKNISHLVVAACMASMLTGCGIYTKYRQPETNTDGLFGALPEEVDTTSSLADLKCAGGEYGFECGPFESGRGTGFAVSCQAGLPAFCPVGPGRRFEQF